MHNLSEITDWDFWYTTNNAAAAPREIPNGNLRVVSDAPLAGVPQYRKPALLPFAILEARPR
jgi:hypothetical protein